MRLAALRAYRQGLITARNRLNARLRQVQEQILLEMRVQQ